jgi:hypothetical protein
MDQHAHQELRRPHGALHRPTRTSHHTTVPLSAEDEDNTIEQLLWKETVTDFITQRQSLLDNLRAIYSVIWRQCSPTMKAKLMSMDDYETKSQACECVWLLRQIKGIMYRFEGQRDIFLVMGEAQSTLDRCKQQPHETNVINFDQFKPLVDAFEHYGGTIGGDKGLIDALIDPDDPEHSDPIPTGTDTDEVRSWISATAKYNNQLARQCRDQTLVMLYLRTADQKKYGDLWIALQNQHSRGNSQYPKDLSAAYSMVAAHKSKQICTTQTSDIAWDTDTTGLSSYKSPMPPFLAQTA